jgi:hypothetical protein
MSSGPRMPRPVPKGESSQRQQDYQCYCECRLARTRQNNLDVREPDEQRQKRNQCSQEKYASDLTPSEAYGSRFIARYPIFRGQAIERSRLEIPPAIATDYRLILNLFGTVRTLLHSAFNVAGADELAVNSRWYSRSGSSFARVPRRRILRSSP